MNPGRLLKKSTFNYEVASAAVNNETGRLVTGSADDTWARVYDLRTDEELGTSTLYSIPPFHLHNKPNQLTTPNQQKSKKVTTAPSGPSASPQTENSTAPAAKTEPSNCGKPVGRRTVCGGDISIYIYRNHISTVIPLCFRSFFLTTGKVIIITYLSTYYYLSVYLCFRPPCIYHIISYSYRLFFPISSFFFFSWLHHGLVL